MAEKKIIQLNQDSERIKEVLDATDTALVVQDKEGNPINDNINKIWLTSVREETGEDGSTHRTSIIETKTLSDLEEYVVLNRTTTDLSNKINNETTGLEALHTEINEMTTEIQEIWNELGTAVAKLTITPVTPTYNAVLFEQKNNLVVKYKFKSIASGNQTGPGRAVWKVNGVEVKTENNIRQNEDSNPEDFNIFDFSSYAILGINTIEGVFTDSYENTKKIIWTINTIKLELVVDNFDKTAINDDVVAINYRVTGLEEQASAQVYFELDGKPLYNMSFAQGDPTKTYWLAKQSHGAHLLKIYATTKLGVVNVSSNVIFLDVMFKEKDKDTPIIAWPYSEKELSLEQYRRQDFEYSVYTPNNPISEITLKAKLTYVDLNDDQEKTTEEEWNVISDWNKVDASGNTEKIMTWSYTPTPQMSKDATAKVELSISSGKTTVTKTFKVLKSSIAINPITSGLVLDFNPRGRTNQDKNYKEFTYENPRYNTTMTVSENFDWTNGGWKKDEDGNDVFLIKNGSRMYLDYPLFMDEENINDAKKSGKHFKFTYKATNCGSFTAQVMKCRENLGRRYEIKTETYGIKDEEPEVLTTTKRYFLNGYNAADKTDDLLWKDGELITQSYELDSRDDKGIGEYITVTVQESFVGVEFKAQEAVLSSSYADLPLVYCEDELMSVSMDIEPAEDRKSLMMAYIDADPSRVVAYPMETSFIQENKQLIEFGSDECDVYVYRFKVYNRNFNTEKKDGVVNEIFDDYVADSLNADEIVEKYNQNNFLDGNGNIKYDTLAEKCPDLRIILITCERFTNDKKDTVKKCTVQHILKNGRPEDNWIAKNVDIKGQGTSSNAYGTSARNIDIKLVKEDGTDYALTYTTKDGDNTTTHTAAAYAMTPNSIPVNYFNIKVNVASSENANNACLADWYNNYDPYVRQVRIDNPMVRDTMEFHPCVIFIQETNTANWQEFKPDGQFHFYACGDFGNSKKNHQVFGMDKNNLKECVVEISNNTHPIARFKTPDGWDDILPAGFDVNTNQLTDYVDYWDGDAIEFRYPEDLFAACVNKDNKFKEDEIADARTRLGILQPQVQRLWRWIQSTDTTAATNIGLIPSVTYDEVDENGDVIYYDLDSVEYRQAKFKHEYQNYFVKESLLFQYLFTDRYLMIDNRAKNMFLHTVDGEHWDFTLDYDNDTSLGCENSGYLTLDYNLEDRDTVVGIPVYNGNDSVLWENVRTLLKEELEDTYNNDRCKEAWSASNLLEKMHNYQWVKPVLLQMMDMQRKYIRPYKTGHGQSTVSEPQYLERLNGRKTLQRKRFETYREIFTGSKYRAPSFHSSAQSITMRVNHNPGYVEITPYCDMYPYFKWGNTQNYPSGDLRVKAGQKVRIDISSHGLGPSGNQEVHFCGATMLSDLGNLAGFKIAEGNFSKGTKIKRLYIGDHSGNIISGTTMTNVILPDSPLLEEFDISNTEYSGTLNFTKQVMLKKVYTVNSNTSSVTFAPNGFLEEAKLNAVTNLSMEGLTKLKDFTMSYDLLSKISIINTPYLTHNLNTIKELGRRITGTIAGLNVEVPEEDINVFDRFINENKSNLILSGSAKYDLIYESQTKQYSTVWPNLSISWNRFIEELPVYFRDYDGSLVDVVYVTKGQTPLESIDFDSIKPNERPATDSTIYTFSGWDGNFNDPVTEKEDSPQGPRTFTAKYSEETRKYKITWWKDRINGEKLYEGEYEYGSNAEYQGIELNNKYNENLKYWSLFSGWNNSTAFVQTNLDVVAQWEDGYIGDITRYVNGKPEFIEGFDPRNLKAAQIYTMAQKNEAHSYFGESIGSESISNFDRIKIKLGADFNYSNLEKINLIEGPMIFTGEAPIETNISLMDDINKSWTLFVDLRFINAAAKEVMVSCYNEEISSGFKIVNSDQNYPFIKYGEAAGDSEIISGGSRKSTTEVNDNGPHLREVFVIVHKAGEKAIHTYSGMFNKIEPQYKKLEMSGNAWSHNGKLVLGGYINKNTNNYDVAHGVLHHCELYNIALGSEDCKKLAMWPREDAEFTVASFSRQRGVNGGLSRIDFIAAQSTWAKLESFSKTPQITSFFESHINKWLNDRFIKALPISWQTILLDTKVKCSTRDSSNNTKIEEEKSTKIWIPSIKELNLMSVAVTQGNKLDIWNDEGYAIPLFKGNHTPDINTVFTPGCPTTDVYGEGSDWYYNQESQPENAPNGAVWYTGSNYYINYYGFWMRLGGDEGSLGSQYITTRSVDLSFGNLRKMYYYSGITAYLAPGAGYKTHIVPCFSV